MKTFQRLENKIFLLDNLLKTRAFWASQNKIVVFTNGCFDLLHLGHINYLSAAADLGDKLIIAVNSDSSVSKLKGLSRPLQDERSRLLILASLSFVDAVFLFHEETPSKVIELLIPDILVKGGDYKENEIVGADFVKKQGGKVIILPFLPNHSTSLIEKKIRDIK